MPDTHFTLAVAEVLCISVLPLVVATQPSLALIHHSAMAYNSVPQKYDMSVFLKLSKNTFLLTWTLSQR